ncbi:MAG: oligosaccharide flippase family protein [Candidatus Atribacteria bacterium]|nr:oligosaccharide flippase family protein [Candidatus Atribacteria bacterium]
MKEVKKSFSDLLFIYLANIFAIPLMLVSEAFQGRYLKVDDYGMVSLILSFISLVYFFSFSWMGYSILRFGKVEYDEHNHLHKVNTSFLIINSFLLILTIILYFIFEKTILDFFNITQNFSFRIVIILGFILLFLKNYIFQLLKTINHLKHHSFLDRILPKFLICIFILLLALIIKKFNVLNIILIFLFTDLFIIIIGLFYIKKEYLFPFTIDTKIIKAMLLFSLPLFFGSWSNYIIDWIDLYAIKYFLTMNDVGIYSAAYKLFNAGKYIISSGIIAVTVPIIILFKSKNQTEKIVLYITRLTPQITLIGFVILSVTVYFIDYLIILIYGNKFEQSITPLKILIASQAFGFINYMLSAVLIAYSETRFLSIIGIILALLNLTGDVFLIPLIGYNGASISTMLVFSINAIIIHFFLNRKFRIKRNISLLISTMLLLITFINIVFTSMLGKGLITLTLITATVLLCRHYSLFKKSDIELFINISLPVFVRKLLTNIILILSRN